MYTFDYTINIVMTADGGYVALHLTKEKVIKFQFL